jgi:hypothetical protein
MRKFSTIALVSCLTLGATAAFAAQTSTTPSTSMDKPAASGTMSKTTKATTATTKTTKTTMKAHKVTGDISKLDCTANTATVGTTDINLNATTKVTVKGKKATCADLKDGMKATASYTTDKDGKNWAKYVSAK